MPVPDEILRNSISYERVWRGDLPVRGRDGSSKLRTFHAYVEVMEQGAHDPTIRSVFQSRGGAPRPMHEGRVKPKNDNAAVPFAYYSALGRQAAEIASNWMTEQWAAQKTVEDAERRTVITKQYADRTPALTSAAKNISVQKLRQDNGFSFEITMWYQVSEIYLAFHCYFNNRLG